MQHNADIALIKTRILKNYNVPEIFSPDVSEIRIHPSSTKLADWINKKKNNNNNNNNNILRDENKIISDISQTLPQPRKSGKNFDNLKYKIFNDVNDDESENLPDSILNETLPLFLDCGKV
ncbi:hypothetical protein U3516DRAFT_763861 [Neocallimastix sp. 'constans']